MKKIMFNDRYGLTQAVLEGRKTMTRRIIPLCENDLNFLKIAERGEWLFSSRTCLDGAYPAYNVGDELAVAQSYSNLREVLAKRDFKRTDALYDKFYRAMQMGETHDGIPGWGNKMFVRADLMPHRIRITNIKAERLQDISKEDCLKEGITTIVEGKKEVGNGFGWDTKADAFDRDTFFTAKAAFAALIDSICGKGTWERNPLVFAYTFELIK